VAVHLRLEAFRLELRDPFRIARSDQDAGQAVTTVVVELRDPSAVAVAPTELKFAVDRQK